VKPKTNTNNKGEQMSPTDFEINQEVVVDGKDYGTITFIDRNDNQEMYCVESALTGSTYYIRNTRRLEATNI
jgi:hypothetical protein